MMIDVCINCAPLDPRILPAQMVYKLDNLQKRFNDTVVAALSEVECPQHGQHPQVISKGTSTHGAVFSINGCCKELLNMCQTVVDEANNAKLTSRI